MHKFFMKIILFLSLMLPVLTGSMAFSADCVIICNKEISENSLTEKEIKDIFTWNKKRWEDGTKITFVLLKDPDVFSLFTRQFLKKNYIQYERSIKNEIFINGYKSPKSFTSEKELIDFVSKTKGAIGFVSQQPETWDVKPIAIK